jgi:hypothetical protein
MIVKDHRGKYWRVFPITGATDQPDSAMAHLWHGFEMKHLKKGLFHEYLSRAGKRRWTYVKKVGSTVVKVEQ